MTSVNSASSSSASTPTPTSSSNGANNNNNNNNSNSNNTNGTNTNSNTNQFYRLKVEDALSYLDQVKFQFEKQPEVYNQFLDIMKEFKSQSIDTPGVISRVSNLFRGHTDLIEGFNTFLPPGYKIEVQANDSVHFTAPNSNSSTLVQPISNFQPAAIINNNNNDNKTISANNNNHVSATLVNLTSNIVNNKSNEPIKMDPLIITPIPLNNGASNSNGFKNLTQNNAAQLSVKIITNNSTSNNNNNVVQPIVKSSSTPPPINPQPTSSTTIQTNATTVTAAPQSQVEFGHAINYVNKIKSRFSNQPDIYKSFLEILHTYQKQQKNIKEGIPLNTQNFLSEAEVYDKVAKLFKNQEDLLIEFSQFLPDANNSNAVNSKLVNNQNQSTTISNDLFSSFNNNQFSQNSILNVPIPTVLTSTNTLNSSSNSSSKTISSSSSSSSSTSSSHNNNLISSTIAKQQLKVPVLAQPNNLASPSSSSTTSSTSSNNKTKFNSENMNNQQQQSHQPSNNNFNNSLTCKTNTSATNAAAASSANDSLSSSSVKRASTYQTLPNKKQRLANTNMNSLNNNNNNNNLIKSNKPNDSNSSNVEISLKKYNGTINEITFFERVKKALRNQQIYENFLKCLALFNQDIVTHTELISMVEPFLSKFVNLYKWFKEYVEIKSINNLNSNNLNDFSSINMSHSPKHHNNLSDHQMSGGTNSSSTKNRLYMPPGGNYSLQIDYLACKQYGASYRDISSYPQPISTGQTELCKQVLNSIYVSFPLWSEDSTYVSSKKNQYEELIFRIEDERFELDVVLESNLSTIRVLENVMSKLSQMSLDESNKHRLTDAIGGTSETVHIKAIQRVYGDKAKDFIDGLKRNPSVVVPIVLKRLKAKDEEWREAKKNSEKIWREQIERNYLKSLDHCAASFKQNDQKHLKAKSLTNEIEQIYNEREKAKEDALADAYPIANATNSCLNDSSKRPLLVPTTTTTTNQPVVERNPHLIIKYEEKGGIDDESILEDAAALIIHHVKRQQGIHKEDKNKMKQIMKHFIPDFFFVTRGCLSDDESESIVNKQQKNQVLEELIPNQETTTTIEDVSTKKLRSSTVKAANQENQTDKSQHLDTKQRLNPSIQISNNIDNNDNHSPEDMYRLFFVDDHWYLFFRYHHILCERLFKIYKNSLQITEQETIDSKSRDKSVAEALKLRNKPEIASGDYYKKFLEIVRSLLDLNMEPTQYEDTLREMFGINAYIAFTLDKVVQNCVRQLQFLVQDETSSSVRHLYANEQKFNNLSFGFIYGRVSNMYNNVNIANTEFSYQKKTEQLLTGSNCFQINSYKNSNRLTIQLLDTQEDDEDSEEIAEIEKWSEYIEKYCSMNEEATNPIGNQLKELLLKKPVFLTRNAHSLKTKYEKHLNKQSQQQTTTDTDKNQSNQTSEENKLTTVNEQDTIENNKNENENNNDNKKETDQQPLVIKDDSVYRLNPNSYKLSIIKGGTSLMYRRNSFKNAKKCHQTVTRKMYDKFRKFSNKWLKFNSTPTDGLESWLLGEIYPNCKTVRVKEYQPKKTPYHVYYKYKLPDQLTSLNTSALTNTKLLKTETPKASSSDSEISKKPIITTTATTKISSSSSNVDEKTSSLN